MDQEDELEWLKRQIDSYKALARQLRDDETARLIEELVSRLEQRLNAKLNQAGRRHRHGRSGSAVLLLPAWVVLGQRPRCHHSRRSRASRSIPPTVPRLSKATPAAT
jgi:hypothetical protein